MGKLNYVARKLEGLKAGQILSKDLRKRTIPGPSARSTARDPTLEIDATGKEMTDEGFAQFIDDLIGCIMFRDDEHQEGAAKLTELHLQGNQLTIESLAKLAQVVTLSVGSLRELDISRNNIEVVTPEQKSIWQGFLESFEGCYLLKKLDLGDNPLGASGLEILARVYIQSEVDFLETEAADVLGASKSEEDEVTDVLSDLELSSNKENVTASSPPKKQTISKPKTAKMNVRNDHHSGCKLTQANLKHYSCTRGLRSVPYIILSNVCTTSGGAVHIASMIALHKNPEQLLEYLPAGKSPALPDMKDKCSGLIWFPSENLGQYGQKLLEMADDMRHPTSASSESDEGLSDDLEESSSATEDTDLCNSKALRQRQKKRDFEYFRVCRRARVEALKNEGVHSAQLWSTALRMIVVSRALLLEDKDRDVINPPTEMDNELEQEKASDEEASKHEETSEEETPETESKFYNAPLIFPEQEICEWGLPGEFPLTPGLLYQSKAYHENFPDLQGNLPSILISAPEEPSANGDTVRQPVTFQTEGKAPPPSTNGSAPRPKQAYGHRPTPPVVAIAKKQDWRFGFPFELWRRIIADAVGANGILDKEQQTFIMRYASDWDAVTYELGMRGALENEQIWKILETVNCISYSPLSGCY